MRVGILTGNPQATGAEVPIAIVCEFSRRVSDDVLREAHRLSWNFCRAPLLLTIEPHVIRAWSCCEAPSAEVPQTTEIEPARQPLEQVIQRAESVLEWVNLASGEFFRRYADRFRLDGRADTLLLANLSALREQLRAENLSLDTSHDLIARIIFVQFLFQRKDSQGVPALNKEILHELVTKRILKTTYSGLAELLADYDDTYQLFRWLNRIFNGDLFPGKAASESEREAEWQAEMSQVRPKHLELLSRFASGNLELKNGQYSLWPQYAFDAIPLEFVSSIYEEFVNKELHTGLHYTPSHLVDFMLDGVLPWNGEEWNLKVLDPACGSGTFLVKIFQRLVQRWKNAHSDVEVTPGILTRILKDCIFGVDIDAHAARVASFSLYLALCDELDPRKYWKELRFPLLRGEQIIAADFFAEDIRGIRTRQDEGSYDLVVGNAPWSSGSMTRAAASWAEEYGWKIANRDIGTLFLAKAGRLVRGEGRVVMLQSANSLLFNRSPTSTRFRQAFFGNHKVEEIVNFSALRFSLFGNTSAPICSVSFRPVEPDQEGISYISPKPEKSAEDGFRIVIDPEDIHSLDLSDVLEEVPIAFTTMMWGGRRDLRLVRRLEEFPTLADYIESGDLIARKGYVSGDHSRNQEEFSDFKLLSEPEFPEGTFLLLDPNGLPSASQLCVDKNDSRKVDAFQCPQLIVKKAVQESSRRFSAALITEGRDARGVICTQSYVSVHACTNTGLEALRAACLVFNSSYAVYHLMLTSGRVAAYRPEAQKAEVMRMPIPPLDSSVTLSASLSSAQVDELVFEALRLRPSERILVDDLVHFTVSDHKFGGVSSLASCGFQPIPHDSGEAVLREYCETLLRAFVDGFGGGMRVTATIFSLSSEFLVPVRLIALHFGTPDTLRDIEVADISETNLLDLLRDLHMRVLRPHSSSQSGILFQRTLKAFDLVPLKQSAYDDGGKVETPTVFLAKPNQHRYWTRSMALRDADELASEIILASQIAVHASAGV